VDEKQLMLTKSAGRLVQEGACHKRGLAYTQCVVFPMFILAAVGISCCNLWDLKGCPKIGQPY